MSEADHSVHTARFFCFVVCCSDFQLVDEELLLRVILDAVIVEQVQKSALQIIALATIALGFVQQLADHLQAQVCPAKRKTQ